MGETSSVSSPQMEFRNSIFQSPASIGLTNSGH